MVNDSTYEDLFSFDDTLDNQLIIFTSNGDVIDNERIVTEAFTIHEGLSSDSLEFGSCMASRLNMRIISDESLEGQTIEVFIRIGDGTNIPLLDQNNNTILDEDNDALVDGGDAFKIGTFIVTSDKPTSETAHHDIEAYDALYTILNKDLTSWYRNQFLAGSITIKKLRDNLFAEFGIKQVPIVLANDNLKVKRYSLSKITGADIIKSICQINGTFGHINREGEFKYIILDKAKTPVKEYDRYIQNSLSYETWVTEPITAVEMINSNDNKKYIAGSEGNTYSFSNLITDCLTEADLQSASDRLLTVISGISYRPFSARSYGDYCIEVGDCIKVKDITSYVLERDISGIQALRDNIESGGYKKYEPASNGIYSQIQQINSTDVIKVTSEGKLVKATVNGTSESGKDIVISSDNIDFIANGELNLTSKVLKINSNNFSVDAEGKMTCSSANITGGSINIETDDANSDKIKLTFGNKYVYISPSSFMVAEDNKTSAINAGQFNLHNGETFLSIADEHFVLDSPLVLIKGHPFETFAITVSEEIMNLTNYIANGYIYTGSKIIDVIIPLGKPCANNVSRVTFSGTCSIRANGQLLGGTTSINPSSYGTVECSLIGDTSKSNASAVRFRLNLTDAWSGVPNNSLVSIQFTGTSKLTFN